MKNNEQIKKALRNQFKEGTSKMAKRICYGYTQDEKGNLIIDEEKSVIVKRIFNLSFRVDLTLVITNGIENAIWDIINVGIPKSNFNKVPFFSIPISLPSNSQILNSPFCDFNGRW